MPRFLRRRHRHRRPPAQARQLWLDAIHTLRDGGRRSLTVLLLGKSGAGKSSAINALLGQQAVKVGVNKLTAQGELVRRVVVRLPQGAPGADDDDAGFRVRLLDTAGLVDQSAGDAVDRQALLDVAASLAKTDVDLVLYVDRLDLYCVDALDKALVRAIGDTFGGRLWHKAALLLTRSDMKYTPSGMSYGRAYSIYT